MSDSPGSPERPRPRRSSIRRSALLGAPLMAVAVTLAACGGGSPTSNPSTTSGAASSGGSSSSGASNSLEQQALRYAQCMRSHGVTNYADPTPGKSQSVGQSGLDTNSPTYQAAASACQKYQPTTGSNTNQGPTPQGQSQQLQFAQCMRRHGVPNFPDPGSDGGIPKGNAQHFAVSDSQWQAAEQACQPVLPMGGSLMDRAATKVCRWREFTEVADDRHRLLLRTQATRRGRSAGQQQHQLTAGHSKTSSLRSRSPPSRSSLRLPDAVWHSLIPLETRASSATKPSDTSATDADRRTGVLVLRRILKICQNIFSGWSSPCPRSPSANGERILPFDSR